MIWNSATWALLFWAMMALLYVVLLLLRRAAPPFKVIEDVPLFLRPVDLEQAETLLDPAHEYELRWKLDSYTLREVQRRRARLFLELVARMSHNAIVLIQMGNREAERHSGSTLEAIEALQREAVKVRMYALFTMTKLFVYMMVRPSNLPSLPPMRKAVDVDCIANYKALRQASMKVFEQLGRPLDQLIVNY